MADSKNIYCALCGNITTHALIVDHNNDTVASCECGHFVKFPAGANLDELVIAHQAQNDPLLKG